MTSAQLSSLYRPTHDESSRQMFVGALKNFANGALEAQLAELYEQRLLPEFVAAHGRAPADRREGRPLFETQPLYQLWGSMVYASQGLMWQTVGATCRRIQAPFERGAAAATQQPRGTLTLDPALQPPRPISAVEIHRQPGGYFASAGATDLFAGLVYFGTIELYRAAKGLSAGAPIGEPGLGRYIVAVLRKRYPGLKPRRILDLGCGPGIETLALQEAFPDAEVHGLDLSEPFVRFAHAWAEDRGVTVHYREADARHAGYPDGHFDLIVSHILFHETWHDVLPGIFAEAHRLLAPDGVFLNADVPYQPGRMPIPKQVTNDWQVRNNGEPFWTGFADTDVPAALANAGFAAAGIVADYEPLGAGHYYFFGGTKGAKAPGRHDA